MLALCLVPAHVPAEDGTTTEYRVKTAFLYNFSRFVTWPQPINNTFKLCVVGNNPFDGLLDSLIGKTVQNNILVVEEYNSLENVHDCQLVYISRSFEPRLGETLAELKSLPILTISDIESFTSRGGMIRFRLADNKVRFDINADAAGDAGLTISSKLLSLATVVKAER
jgi:hypothetical protein